MELTLVRDVCGTECTLGKLFVDGKFGCYTVEDVVRPDGTKIPGRTAIPEGRYRLVVTRSPRFGRELPLLENRKRLPITCSRDAEVTSVPGIPVDLSLLAIPRGQSVRRRPTSLAARLAARFFRRTLTSAASGAGSSSRISAQL
jgi:hypothetical protein